MILVKKKRGKIFKNFIIKFFHVYDIVGDYSYQLIKSLDLQRKKTLINSTRLIFIPNYLFIDFKIVTYNFHIRTMEKLL